MKGGGPELCVRLSVDNAIIAREGMYPITALIQLADGFKAPTAVCQPGPNFSTSPQFFSASGRQIQLKAVLGVQLLHPWRRPAK